MNYKTFEEIKELCEKHGLAFELTMHPNECMLNFMKAVKLELGLKTN
jgi:hypothetical protein